MPEYAVQCSECDFEITKESAEFALTIRDLHELYNKHEVEVRTV